MLKQLELEVDEEHADVEEVGDPQNTMPDLFNPCLHPDERQHCRLLMQVTKREMCSD